MRFKASLVTIFVALSSLSAQASEVLYRVHSFKSITSNVERLLDKNGNPFGTMFCREDAAIVMIVDNGPLDGRNFHFSGMAECNQARQKIKALYDKCQVFVAVDSQGFEASVKTQQCQ